MAGAPLHPGYHPLSVSSSGKMGVTNLSLRVVKIHRAGTWEASPGCLSSIHFHFPFPNAQPIGRHLGSLLPRLALVKMALN